MRGGKENFQNPLPVACELFLSGSGSSILESGKAGMAKLEEGGGCYSKLGVWNSPVTCGQQCLMRREHGLMV